MANNITINGETVDADDPCALYLALYRIKLKRLAGEQVAEGTIRSPVTHRQMVYATVPLAELDRELNALKTACEAKTTGKPARFAIRAGFRY